MKGLRFENVESATPVIPVRNDVACFLGLAAVRSGSDGSLPEVPESLRRWLVAEGWWTETGAGALRPGSLLDVPLPIGDWATFDHLFAWEQRPYGKLGGVPVSGAGYLGAAVRSFFAQGGRKCYVVSAGAPLSYDAPRAARDAQLAALLPVYQGQRSRREQWHGLHHLFGLPEVAFVTLPDLAELAADAPPRATPAQDLPPPAEPRFTACVTPTAAPEANPVVRRLNAPWHDAAGFGRWRVALRRALHWLHDWRRDVQLLAALPQAEPSSEAAADPLVRLHATDSLRGDLARSGSLASPRLQLLHPWLQLDYAGDLPAALEPGEGVLAGLLARNALTRGTWRNASGQPLLGLRDLSPRLSRAARLAPNPQAPQDASPQAPLIDRVSLLDETPAGRVLRSDVTTDNDPLRRQAAIERTLGMIWRAARLLGDEFVFENSGESLWRRVEQRLGELLTELQDAGALAGRRPGEAFGVRCDRATMSQQDIDNGRVIAQLWVRPVASIETLRIQLTLGDAGQVSLRRLGREAA